MPAAGAKLTQDGRPLVLTTPLGKDKLLALSLSAREAISQLFAFDVEAFAPAQPPIDVGALLGQGCEVELTASKDSKRTFHGLCSRVAQLDRDEDFVRYRLTLVPRAWLLTRVTDCYVFQQKSVPDILKEVFQGVEGMKWEISGTYEPRDHCTQYRESDFDFASRLMEEEGIYYFFVHSAGKHEMVVTDSATSHRDLPVKKKVPFAEDQGGSLDEDRIHDWNVSQELRSGKVTLWDHHFELTAKHLETESVVQPSADVGGTAHKLKVGGNDALDLYDYPGGYAQRFDGIDPGGGEQADKVQKIFEDNKRTSGIRMQQETSAAILVQGESDVGRFAPGQSFELTRAGKPAGTYVTTSVEHHAKGGGNYGSGDADAFAYENSFECVPASVPYRPARVTPRPYVRGSQTAIVVGPGGEEIFTDKYGRVKVQFPWDRVGKQDANSSCWVRVATTWAGKQWGAIHIPRIGQEVVVDFLEGDPDRPIIVGSVYNAEQMPPYELPANKTQSGIKTRTSPGGDGEKFNEIRFEDKDDAEEIYVHAQKFYKRIVEHSETVEIGVEQGTEDSQSVTVHGNRVFTIMKGDETFTLQEGSRSVTLDEGDDALVLTEGGRKTEIKKDDELTLAEGGRKVTIQEGDDTLDIQKGNCDVTLGQGNYTLTVSQGNLSVKVSAGKQEIEAAQSIEFKVGGSSIKIEPAKITIKAPQIAIEADATLDASGAAVTVEGKASADVKSPLTTVKGDGMLTLKGGVTMIN